MRLPWSQLVFVAGHPRGGTTWLGAVLGAASEARYIFEPQLVEKHPQTSFSRRVAEYNQLPRWYLSSEEDLEPYRRALVGHLGELIQSYFHRQEVDTLVIKIPETERLPWLLRSLEVDRLVYVRRHPLGVINSYDKARIYWAVRRSWSFMLRDVADRFPELLDLVRPAGEGDLERTAATIHLRYRLLERTILKSGGAHPPIRVVDYERLAADPWTGYQELFAWLGWRWTEELAAKLEPYFRPAVEKRGFFEVEKESHKRIYAWRRELAPWQIRRAVDFFAAVGAQYPVPGAGLPELTRHEKLAAVSSFANRRARHAYRWVAEKLQRAVLRRAQGR